MKLTVLSGTNRPASNTHRIATIVAALHRSAGHDVTLLDLKELPAALFTPAAYAAKPPTFAPFADAITRCNGLHVICPEYNGGFPGVLKLFIDMLPFPESFEARPVAFVGLAAGQWGALRPIEQLQAIFGYRNAHVFPTPVFIPGINDQLSDDGQLTENSLAARLQKQCTGFATFIARLQTAC
jgi:NAD(P)H-dependent FMN reductase